MQEAFAVQSNLFHINLKYNASSANATTGFEQPGPDKLGLLRLLVVVSDLVTMSP